VQASERTIPSSVEAEDATLGALLIDKQAIVLVRNTLKPTDFYHEKCGIIYKAMLACADAGQPTDIIMVADRLEQAGVLDDCGGHAYLTSLMVDLPDANHAEYYAGIVKRHAVARRVIAAAGEIAKIGYSDLDAPDMRAEMETVIQGVREEADSTEGVVDNAEAIRRFMDWQDNIERTLAGGGSLISSPWPNLNAFLPAFLPGTLTVVAAAPGHGKTLSAESIAEYNAQHGKRVLYIHPELTVNQMIARQMGRYGTSFAMSNIVRGISDRGEAAQIGAQIGEWPGKIFFRYCPGISPAEVGALIRTEAALGRCDLAIVDYLHILNLQKERGQTDEMALGLAAMTIKTAGAMAGVPVILLAQINREYVGRTKEPRLIMSDIRGSGQLEAFANAIVMIYNHAIANPTELTALITMYIAKNTFGQTGTCEMLWERGHYRFMPRVMGI
jgi:replicative DNA helicase